ncbi:MAG: HD domain-containing protein [Saprospirales bacterium]|nr:MAG: HD domain-containing protein [Saprospirales bacterium]
MKFSALKKYFLDKLDRELSPQLTYHGLHHTLDVLEACESYIERYNIREDEAELLRIGAVIHDIGFLETYSQHEEKGVEIAKEAMPYFGYNASQIKVVEGLILATKVPQQPQNFLEQIICDADLDYLGRDDFYPIAETLFEELKHFVGLDDRKKWNEIQVNFLNTHNYHTDWAREFRAPAKARFLKELMAKV